MLGVEGTDGGADVLLLTVDADAGADELVDNVEDTVEDDIGADDMVDTKVGELVGTLDVVEEALDEVVATSIILAPQMPEFGFGVPMERFR
jgi:uncharacterized protein YciU (UPF0263 family)